VQRPKIEDRALSILYPLSSIVLPIDALLDAPNQILGSLDNTITNGAGALDNFASLVGDSFTHGTGALDDLFRPLDSLPQHRRPLFANGAGGLFGTAGAMRNYARP